MDASVKKLYSYLAFPVCDTRKLADGLINQSFTAHRVYCMRKWKLKKIICHFYFLKMYWIPLLFFKPQWFKVTEIPTGSYYKPFPWEGVLSFLPLVLFKSSVSHQWIEDCL